LGHFYSQRMLQILLEERGITICWLCRLEAVEKNMPLVHGGQELLSVSSTGHGRTRFAGQVVEDRRLEQEIDLVGGEPIEHLVPEVVGERAHVAGNVCLPTSDTVLFGPHQGGHPNTSGPALCPLGQRLYLLAIKR